MKRIIILMLAMALCGIAFAEGGYDLTMPEFVDLDSIDDPSERAEASINYFHNMLYGSELDHVIISPNDETADPDDAIAQIYMNYTDIHSTMPSIDKDVAIRVSEDTIALAMEYDFPQVVKMTVFWHFVQYNEDGQISFEKDYYGWQSVEELFPLFMTE